MPSFLTLTGVLVVCNARWPKSIEHYESRFAKFREKFGRWCSWDRFCKLIQSKTVNYHMQTSEGANRGEVQVIWILVEGEELSR